MTRAGAKILAALLGTASVACAPPPTTWSALAARSSSDAIGTVRVLADQRTGGEVMVALLSAADPDVRREAALGLGRLEQPSHRQALEDALSDPAAGVRRVVAFALGQSGDATAEPALLARLMSERHPIVQVALWRALGRVGGQATLTRARETVGMMRPLATSTSGLVLARLKRASPPPWLLAAASDRDEEVRAGALYAFSRFSGKPRATVPEAVIQQAVRSLGSGHAAEREAAVRLLSRGTTANPTELARVALEAALPAHQTAALVRGVAHARTAAATSALVRVLAARIALPTLIHPNFHVLDVAARALPGRRLSPADETMVKRLRARLAERTTGGAPEARRVAALRCSLGLALGELKGCPPERTVRNLVHLATGERTLRQMTSHRRPAVRMAALAALAKSGTKVMGVLRQALGDPDMPVVATAATLLADYPGSQAAASAANDAALAAAWERASTARNWEVAQDILRAMVAVKAPSRVRAAEQAVSSGQLAMARAGVAILRKQGRVIEVPVPPLPAVDAAAAERWAPSTDEPRVAIDTEVGTIVVRLLPRWAPRTVGNFSRLAREGAFDGLTLHRVVANFVVQGGDPRGDGWGGPGYTIRCENNPVSYRTGTVGMALAGKDTGGSQWFITHAPQPHLYGTYSVFGQVEKGQRVVDRIVAGDRILKIREL